MAGLIANGSNVATTFVLSHFLATRGYGAFNLLVYLFLVLSMPGYAVIVAVVRQVSAWEATDRHDLVTRAVARWRIGSFAIFVAVLALSLALGPRIAGTLSLPNASGIVPILAAGAAWLLLSVDRGLIQARRQYRAMARNLVVEGVTRTAGTLLLVAVGLGVGGAMLAILASAVIADLDARISLRVGPATRTQTADLEELAIATAGEVPGVGATDSRPLRDFLVALVSLALLASLAGLDVIVVGKMEPAESGAYAAIAVVSKVLFFAALVLSAYLLPEATTRWHRGLHAYRQLAVTLCFTFAAALIGEAVALPASRPALSLVFPRKLVVDSRDLPTLIAAMMLLAASVVITYYLLGIGRHGVVVVLACGTILLASLLAAAGGRPWPTVRADLVAQAALLSALVAYLGASTKAVQRRVTPDSVPPPKLFSAGSHLIG